MKRVFSHLLILSSLIFIVGVGAALVLGSERGQASNSWPQVLPAATPSRSPQIEGVVAAISERLLADLDHTPVLQLASTSIEEVRLSDDENWASALLVPTDPETGETLPSDPGLAVLSQTDGDWRVFLPTDEGWRSALQRAPENLISAERKTAWIEIYDSTLEQIPDGPLSGYLLPWAGGITRSLSQSTTHDVYTPSGSAHYAFDFYTSGQMWNIYASKSGTVWSWRDDVATCLQYTCSSTQPYGNFIVLQDTTTTPTSYQLYLHLAQGSIPPYLKQIGAPVQQGQLIGTADNTGQSWGHHLHFQVHTNPSSYWGYSVDILFGDVAINGGRPRTVAEASAEDLVGQRDYLSLNFVQDDSIPPIGGLLDPLDDGFEVMQGQLQLNAWAIDQQSGVARAQIEAYYAGQWHPVGPQFTGPQMSYNWDLCASEVPIGPLSLRLEVVDYANNKTAVNNGLRHGVNNTSCQPPPPTCMPDASQIAVFSAPDFSGACQIYDIGNYPDLFDEELETQDGWASILVGDQVAATLYNGEVYQGRRETFSQSDAGFSDNVFSGRLGSMRVIARSTTPGTPELQPAPDSSLADETLLFHWLGSVNNASYRTRILSGGTITRTGELDTPFWQVQDLPAGAYQWQVQAVSSSGSTSSWSPLSSFSLDENQPATSVYTATYSTLFDPVDPGWIWTGDWQLSTGEQHFRSPPQAFLFEPADSEQPAHGSLTSPEITLPADNLALTFYYRYQGESGVLWDQRRIQISANDGPFEDVLLLQDDPPGIWLRSPAIDLSSYSGQKIRVRFSLHSLDEFANDPLSWEIDDFDISPLEALTCPAALDPGETPDQALPLVVGGEISGTLCPAGDRDLYSLEITQPETTLLFTITASETGSPLDSYLLLYDSDGTSLLAANDDAVPYTLTDSRLGYTFHRPGRYYLMVKAWDHPQAGGPDFRYSLAVSQALAGQFYAPQTGTTLGSEVSTLQLLAQDSGGVVQSIDFWWHNGNWATSVWQLLGRDEDGSDGWQIAFDPQGLADQRGMAFYALIEDRQGRRQAAAVWNIALDASGTVFLPIVNR